ncbi:MAG: hypothetical protein CMJ81_02980 [Planctomycetaceae bacterium]|nr:hypothetical protein [Planctomycetaceae bacterium]
MDVCSRVDGAAGGTIGKGCCRTMKIRQSLAKVVLLMMLGACTGPLRANPYAAFIVHCEPRNADGGSLLRLREMVQKADEHQVKLTIDFTPPWVEMILVDTLFLGWVSDWNDAGHELGAHHHPYWVSTERGTNWDGYTNTPEEELLGDDADDYLGDMDDYLALLNQLPGTRTSGTLGLGYSGDELDWPQDLLYSATGHAYDEIVGQPELVEYDGHEVWQMNHGLFFSVPPVQIESAYQAAGSDDIFAVVTHVSNYEESVESVQAVEDFFAFLTAEDPTGESLVTVSQAMRVTIPEPATGVLFVLTCSMLAATRLRVS